ncbi:MAG: hypothetical protein EOP06_21300 [Proteobacteria bacterium]|nr:MAG: hypothetical protein EOP06_21300 [Pseudomonadota bacterium]
MATSKDMGKQSVNPTAGVKNGGPDAETKAAKAKDPQLNAQRGRDALSTGERGSNHVGQGSDGATNPNSHPAGTEQAEASKVRKGNSGQDSSDQEDNQDMEMNLGGGSDEELDTSRKANA